MAEPLALGYDWYFISKDAGRTEIRRQFIGHTPLGGDIVVDLPTEDILPEAKYHALVAVLKETKVSDG